VSVLEEGGCFLRRPAIRGSLVLQAYVMSGVLQQTPLLPSTAFAHRREDRDCNLYYVFELCVNVLSHGVHCMVPPSLTVLTALCRGGGFVCVRKECSVAGWPKASTSLQRLCLARQKEIESRRDDRGDIGGYMISPMASYFSEPIALFSASTMCGLSHVRAIRVLRPQ